MVPCPSCNTCTCSSSLTVTLVFCCYVQENGEVDAEFALLDPRDIMTKDLDELRALALEKKEKHADRQAGEQAWPYLAAYAVTD